MQSLSASSFKTFTRLMLHRMNYETSCCKLALQAGSKRVNGTLEQKTLAVNRTVRGNT